MALARPTFFRLPIGRWRLTHIILDASISTVLPYATRLLSAYNGTCQSLGVQDMVHGVTITADVMTLVSSVSIYFEVNVEHTPSFFVPLGPILRGRGSLLGALFPMS